MVPASAPMSMTSSAGRSSMDGDRDPTFTRGSQRGNGLGSGLGSGIGQGHPGIVRLGIFTGKKRR
jgi:hypothetical protein